MTIPVEAKPAPQRHAGVEQSSTPITAAARPDGRPTLLASVWIDKLIVENAAAVSAASIRDGFREAWLRQQDAVDTWDASAFRRDLFIDLPAGVTGSELGRRVAEAILHRARQT
jgi:hypothetical protein